MTVVSGPTGTAAMGSTGTGAQATGSYHSALLDGSTVASGLRATCGVSVRPRDLRHTRTSREERSACLPDPCRSA